MIKKTTPYSCTMAGPTVSRSLSKFELLYTIGLVETYGPYRALPKRLILWFRKPSFGYGIPNQLVRVSSP